MKNIIKLLGIFTLIIAFQSCDEESNFKEFDASLTPVYTLSNISDNNLFKINIYKEKELVIEYASNVNALNFVRSDYADNSTDSNYELVWQIIKERTVPDQDNDGQDDIENYNVNYTLSANKDSGLGTLSAISTFQDSSTSTANYTTTVTENEVYN